MTGTVLAVASGKGGVGKTTTAINLGAMLAAAEYSVVVVDTDLGMANVGGYLDFEIDGATLHEVLSGDADVEDAIYHAPGGIDVVPSSTDIYTFAQSQTAQLQQVVADLRGKFEYVLLDTGAGISYDTILPLSLADDVLLVTTPDVAAVRDTAKTAELTSRVDGTVRGAVLTQRGNDILNADNVEGTLDADVLTVVPDDETVPMGIDAGRPLAAFSPNSPSAKAYRELADILTGAMDTPELSGEPTASDAAPPSNSPSPSLADAEFELGTSSPQESPVTEADTPPETTTTDDAPPEDPDVEPTSSEDRPADPESAADATEFDSAMETEPEAEAESTDGTEPTDGRNPTRQPNPPTRRSHRRMAPRRTPMTVRTVTQSTTSSTERSSKPATRTVPTRPWKRPRSKPRRPPKKGDDPDIPTDDVDVPEPTADTATPPDESVDEGNDENEFNTVPSDTPDTSPESTATSEDPETPTDLPDEIVEAEPDDDELEAVPFQDEPVRPGLENDDGEGNDDDDEEKDGLFGRIGSLFR